MATHPYKRTLPPPYFVPSPFVGCTRGIDGNLSDTGLMATAKQAGVGGSDLWLMASVDKCRLAYEVTSRSELMAPAVRSGLA